MKSIHRFLSFSLHSTLNSYTLVFFSNNLIFGLILLLVTFFDLFAGLSGFLAVMVSNTIAYLIGLNKNNIRAGVYGFNSLLVGLGLGLFFEPGPEFYLILFFSGLFTLMFSVAMEGIIGKYGLPFLSLPFLAGLWMVMLATRQFETLHISERGIYSLNEMYALGGSKMVDLYHWFNNIPLPSSLVLYFRSLGAILFQYHLVPGLILAIGLVIYSRIGFLLSLLGFYTAFYYYQMIGANFNELSYGYIGFNFILTAIAIGGFFIVSSKYSFLWVILLTPLISFTITSTSVLFNIFQLSIFSLPFNIIVLLFLYVLRFRDRSLTKPELVIYQQYSPEKNLYSQRNNQSRFAHTRYQSLSLPFFGEWTVTQGHDGAHTHIESWRHAWDFEIFDENDQAFKNLGREVGDYHCFNKPVLAPADGWVTEAIGYVEDNAVGEMNLAQNWGNTIIIKHGEGLFSKLSHLKQGSLRVAKGDYVKIGDVIGACGNSGRSPRPHIHFQVQETPHIGSKTMDYPLGHYIRHQGSSFQLVSYQKPKEKEIISNIQKDNTLSKAFHFIPGQKISFEFLQPATINGKIIHWEVCTDPTNHTYLFCETTQSKAYFYNADNIHYFTHFEGDKHSLLFAFFLAAYKVMFGFYKGMKIEDSYPQHILGYSALRIIQDFVAPFFMFTSSKYSLLYEHIDEGLGDSTLHLQTSATVNVAGYQTHLMNFHFEIRDNSIYRWNIVTPSRKVEVREIAT